MGMMNLHLGSTGFFAHRKEGTDRQAFHGLHPGFFQGVNLGGTSWKGASLGSFLLMLVGARSPPKNQGLNMFK